MKFIRIASYLVLYVTLCSLTSNSQMRLDWKRITDKDYVVKYVSVTCDSIDFRKREFTIDESAYTVSKKSVQLLRDLVNNGENFKEQLDTDESEPIIFTNAFVVLRGENVAGVMYINHQYSTWLFYPSLYHDDVLVLNGKGKTLKEELFKKMK